MRKMKKAIRGYIVRALAKGSQNSLLVRHITNALLADNLITVPDISKHLSYLSDGGYIELTDAKAISRANGCRRAVEAPRGHAKSTTFTFKDSLHSSVYGYKHYEIILSDSSEQAEGFLNDLKTELEENAALREDFGELQGRVWKASVILLSNGVKIEALGAGKKIRGRRHKQWRPDLILCDDLENDENVNTPEQRKKLRDWFYKAVSKAGDTYTDIVYIGTLLHYDALLANVAKNPEYVTARYKGVISFATHTELWEAWEHIYTDLENPAHQQDAEDFFKANEEAMLEGTAVLWEEKLPYYALMVMRISEGEASFSSEIQNEPIDPENCAFLEEWIDYYDDDGKVVPDFSDSKFIFVGANDPSLGKNRKSDTSAIIGIAKDTSTGYLYVVLADIAKRKPDRIIDDALDDSRRLRREYKKPFYKFGVEAVQFQYYFAEIMRQRAAECGEYLPIEEINSVQNKDARIQSLQPFVKNGYLKFSKKFRFFLANGRSECVEFTSHQMEKEVLFQNFNVGGGEMGSCHLSLLYAKSYLIMEDNIIMGMRSSLKKQALDRLNSMTSYGQSKHLDKKKNGGKPAKEKLYSYGSMKTYKGVGVRFTNWAKKHGCRTLDDARPLVGQYLQERINKGLKACTIHKDASALQKLFQIERSELGVKLPPRRREDITLHRSKDTWKGHFSEKNNQDLVDLCRATGMRRIEIKRMRPEDVRRDPDGRVTVHVPLGKGGRKRTLVALTDAPWRLAEAARAEEREFVIDHIPNRAPCHQYRAEYARTMYAQIARDPATLPWRERYCAKGDRAGQWYDREALRVVSENLGHSRVTVLMNYLR